jgi:hypothetical protein
MDDYPRNIAGRGIETGSSHGSPIELLPSARPEMQRITTDARDATEKAIDPASGKKAE